MRKSFCTFLALSAMFCSQVFAAPVGITVKATKGFNSDFEVNVPKVDIGKKDVLGKSAVTVKIPGAGVTFEKDAPELPFLSGLVMVDPMGKPQVSFEKGEPEEIKLENPVAPSKGNFTRDVDPESVAYSFGSTYSKDAWYPSDSELVQIESPFIFRDVRGVRLVVHPVQYNPVKNMLRIYKNFSVQITKGDNDTRNTLPKSKISKVFEPIYKNVFLNFSNISTRLPRLDENGKLLVICYDAFVPAIEPFIAWKTKCGITVKLVKTSEVAAKNPETPPVTPATPARDGETVAPVTANQIKTFIQQEYDLGGLTHIMLIGDAEQVPTLKGVRESADSDPCYTKLAGNDHVPDAIISRLSAATNDEVAYQVAKFINYEQFPETGENASWYSAAMGIASDQGTPKDYERAEWLRNALMNIASPAIDPQTPPAEGNGESEVKSSRRLVFASCDKIYDPSGKKAMVAEGINKGRSLINYIGHGSNSMWVSTGFNNTDCGNLANGWRLPIVWSVACVNGQFVGRTCFSEAFQKAGSIEKPAGSVVMYGATTNMEWVPPCIVQSEINNNYTINELYKTAGGLAMNGIMKGLEEYGTDPKKSGVMMFEQWHLFGDGTLLVRFAPPASVTLQTSITKESGRTAVVANVVNAERNPISGARVTVYTADHSKVITSVSNDEGKAVLNVPEDFGAEAFVTIVGPNLIPVVDQKIQL
ncbi:MAG: hypothetical protein HQM10_06445 [Candidatus Riflebacteria bacterium]|nr:hypothetical protein [Candidatus Riflebacteria bacterium]